VGEEVTTVDLNVGAQTVKLMTDEHAPFPQKRSV
jgi:hypothetical protein